MIQKSTVVRSERIMGVSLIAPVVLFFVALVLLPVLYATFLSFHTQNLFQGTLSFVFLKNYVEAFRSPAFWKAFGVDVIWTFFSVSLQLVVGLGLALLVNTDRTGTKVFRSLLLVPYVVPVIAIALSWRWLLNESYGVLNEALVYLGILDRGDTILAQPGGALATVVVMSVWRAAPFVMIFYWAALRSIPAQLYEVAAIDGATDGQKFLFITLPQLKTVTVTLTILRTIWTFNYFDLIYLTTGGGPANATQHLPILIYRESIGRLRFGYASSLSVLMVLFLMVCVVLYLRITREQISSRRGT